MIQYLIDEIIESAKDNCAGTLLDNDGIRCVVDEMIKIKSINTSVVDYLIITFSSDSGYMVKSSDFIFIMRPYLTNERFIHESIYKPEKIMN